MQIQSRVCVDDVPLAIRSYGMLRHIVTYTAVYCGMLRRKRRDVAQRCAATCPCERGFSRNVPNLLFCTIQKCFWRPKSSKIRMFESHQKGLTFSDLFPILFSIYLSLIVISMLFMLKFK